MRPMTGPIMWAVQRAWTGKPAKASLVHLAFMSTTPARLKVEPFTMPAMSPTMEKGNLGEWKVKEGDTFNAGDVLLEVETDKALMDVEAANEGVLAKILMPSGSKDVAVNDVIAYVAEEGDDLSNLPDPSENRAQESEKPKEEPKEEPKESGAAAASSESKGHAQFTKPAFPSVLRLANQYGIAEPEKDIKGTGPHGMLTKGDVLAHLGKIKGTYGTAKPHHTTISELGGAPSEQGRSKEAAPSPPKVRVPRLTQPLDGDEVRTLILQGLVSMTAPHPVSTPAATVDDILGAYTTQAPAAGPAPAKSPGMDAVFADLLKK
ncbi:dihydrolipoyllysine-residue acetyltransferase [Malassezia caprae]|uniref:Dihydrolipoyllysine-residue acetyltransferase n=1 Tax=Malassezia caprae TaxID=1381934 RepID=A0AAF0E9C9_9BASI|nr:dihydrolipoyllysine-residue acetyltransferase [Malassezia caprae]